MVSTKKRSKEYFAESEYGVKASPRVSNLRSNLPRGGGRDQVGKPYQVRGKWYHPKEDKSYKKLGMASWYGDAFHGRLTANGEIYDMTHLTAAHPTMPLPSYARVTNTANGSSVIVRVNDRGPYSNDRIIDLSKRAAEMLDYTHTGTAKVKVEYVSRAPLDGHDDKYLMASYRPGNAAPDPSDGLPTGVMIAMAGPTPSAAVRDGAVMAFPGQLNDVSLQPVVAGVASNLVLPDVGPIAPERPSMDSMPAQLLVASAEMSYAGKPLNRAVEAFSALEPHKMNANAVIASWQRQESLKSASSAGPYVTAGSYRTIIEAEKVASDLSVYGRVAIERSAFEGKVWNVVNVYPRSGASVDTVLQAAWRHGATDAFAIRD